MFDSLNKENILTIFKAGTTLSGAVSLIDRKARLKQKSPAKNHDISKTKAVPPKRRRSSSIDIDDLDVLLNDSEGVKEREQKENKVQNAEEVISDMSDDYFDLLAKPSKKIKQDEVANNMNECEVAEHSDMMFNEEIGDEREENYDALIDEMKMLDHMIAGNKKKAKEKKEGSNWYTKKRFMKKKK